MRAHAAPPLLLFALALWPLDLSGTPLARAAEDRLTLRGEVRDAGGSPVPTATVTVLLETWEGGYRQRALEARTGPDGAFVLEDVTPARARYAILVSVLKDGQQLESAYRLRKDGAAVAPLAFRLRPAHPLTLRFEDEAGKPIEGALAAPLARTTAAGEEHRLSAESVPAVARTSDAAGAVTFALAGAGDAVRLRVRFPGSDWEERAFRVAGEPDELVLLRAGPSPAGGDARKRYFLSGPRRGDVAPERGYALLLVLPGGDGSADFRPFVERIHENAVPPGFLQAELVAYRWHDDQEIVWPTSKAKVRGMGFTTEEFIEAVVEDVALRHEVDRKRIFTLSWSSGGPACYAASLAPRTPIRGSFVAMSVFRPEQLPALGRARGHAYYLLHSPEDRVCPYRMAEQARDRLVKAGARVELVAYDGGHGWHGDVFGMIRRGLVWLEEEAD